MVLTLQKLCDDLINKNSISIIRMGGSEISNLLYSPDKPTPMLINNAGFNGDSKDFKKWRNDYNKALYNADYNMHVVSCPSFSITGDYLIKLNLYIPTLPYLEILEVWLMYMKAFKKANKKIGIICGFSNEFEKQYKNIKNIFPNDDISNMNLTFIKTPIGCGNEKITYIKTFESIKHKINNSRKCDIYLVACGVYGLSICDYIKELGRNSIYIGGILQLLFGLKGSRWDNRAEISKYYNKHWTYPEFKPKNYKLIEHGNNYWNL
ncbi:MAG: hypothetical protein CMC70_09425 [Flavobacteriaceae bacterium]|nr:hypothetical protein [Flavobacteriaceae bacterium]